MNADKRFQIFERLSTAIPEPTTELEHNSIFELLIAVILSAQATDKGVNIATSKLYAAANTPQAIYDLGIEGLERYIKTIGLYHAKAKNVIATCRILVTIVRHSLGALLCSILIAFLANKKKTPTF